MPHWYLLFNHNTYEHSKWKGRNFFAPLLNTYISHVSAQWLYLPSFEITTHAYIYIIIFKFYNFDLFIINPDFRKLPKSSLWQYNIAGNAVTRMFEIQFKNQTKIHISINHYSLWFSVIIFYSIIYIHKKQYKTYHCKVILFIA